MATELQMIEAQERRQAQLQQQREERARQAQAAREAQEQAQAEARAQAQADEDNSETTAEAAEDAQKSQQERGWTTAVGEAASYAINGGWAQDALNATVSGLNTVTGGALQGADDFVLGYDEMQAAQAEMREDTREQREAGELDPVTSGLSQLNEGLTGVAGGMEAGLLTPFTVASRIANQDSSEWAEPPAELQGNVVAESIFEISRVITATGLTVATAGALGAPAVGTGLTGLAVESAVETSTQRSSEDILFGRTLSRGVGDIADYLGYDGSQLTRDMIEGNKPHAQAMTAVVGFLVNMGVNVGTDQLLGIAGRAVRGAKPSEAAQAVATRTGKSVDEVQSSIDDVVKPVDQTVGTKEPFELENIDNQVPTSKPSSGKTAINEDAIQAQALRGFNPADSATTANRNFFTNYSVFGDDYAAVLREATESLEPLLGKAVDRDKVLTGASEWLERFRLADDAYDLDSATQTFRDLTRTVDDVGSTGAKPITAQEALESSAPTPTGMVVATVLGEEYGARLMRAAQRASNLDSKGIDFSAAVENFIELSEQSHHVLVPLRRGKRVWSVTGDVQQRANVQAVGKKYKPSEAAARALGAPVEEFTGQTQTVRRLWDMAQAGDTQALDTLKNHMRILSYSPPSTAVQEMSNGLKTLSEQLRLGNTGATTQLYYSSMLTRLSPMNAAFYSNIAQAIKQPIGSFLTGDRSFALGQFYGGMTSISDAFQATVKTFRDGIAVNSGSKFDINQSTAGRAKSQLELDKLWEGTQKEFAERYGSDSAGMTEQFAAWIQYQRKTVANTGFMTAAGRLLNGLDEGGKVLLASQEASGRAFQEAARRGIKPGSKEFKEITTRHMSDVFKGGVRNGRIQEDVLDSVKYLTFQTPIPKDGNLVDQAFYGLNNLANNNPVWRWVSPFTRASYTMLEQTGVYMAGTIPGGGQLLATAIPRYRRLLNPPVGPMSAADMMASRRLKGTLATSKMTAVMGVGLGYSGMMTGQNPPEGVPKQSFLIPANNEKGYIAVSYARLEPFATQFSLMADIGHMHRIGVLDNKQYSRATTEILSGIFFSTIDKSFLTGMGDVAALLDIRNFNSGKSDAIVNQLATLVGAAGAGGVVATTRMITAAGDPSQGIRRVSEKGDDIGALWENIALSFNQRFFSGAGNPDMYDPLFGGKVNQGIETGNWFTNVAVGIAHEGLSPGRLKGGKTSYVTDMFDELNYDKDFGQTLREYKGIPLNAEQISMLSRDLHDVAGLHKELEYYMQNDRTFTTLYDEYKRNPSEPTRRRLSQLINGRVNRSIEVAVREGELSTNVEFQSRVATSVADRYGTPGPNQKLNIDTSNQSEPSPVDTLLNMPK